MYLVQHPCTSPYHIPVQHGRYLFRFIYAIGSDLYCAIKQFLEPQFIVIFIDANPLFNTKVKETVGAVLL